MLFSKWSESTLYVVSSNTQHLFYDNMRCLFHPRISDLFIVASICMVLLIWLAYKQTAMEMIMSPVTNHGMFCVSNNNSDEENRKRQGADVRGIFNLAKKYLEQVATIGQNLRRNISNSSSLNCDRKRRIVNAHEMGYFDKVDAMQDIQTVRLHSTKCKMTQFLVRKYYDYSSDNCTLLHRNSVRGNLNKYGAICRENIEDTLVGVSLQDKDVSIGLPPMDGINRNDVTWAFIHIATDGMVDRKGHVITESTRLEPFHCYRKWEPYCKSSAIKKIRRFREVFTIKSIWNTYYHSTVDELARLIMFRDFLLANPQIVIHFSAKHPFLDLLGLGKMLFTSGSVMSRVVYSPGATPCGQSILFQTQLLSSMLRIAAPPNISARENVVLIKRTTKRLFLNHESILSMLTKHAEEAGMAMKVFGDDPLPNVRDTQAMFHNAAIVVAPHGAGEANIILSRPGTVLIEGMCYDGNSHTNVCFQNLARVLGMHWHGLIPKTQCMDFTAKDIEKPFVEFLNLHLSG